MDSIIFPPPSAMSFKSLTGAVTFAAISATEIGCLAVIAALWLYRLHSSILHPLTSTVKIIGCMVILSSQYAAMFAVDQTTCAIPGILLFVGIGLV
ncbi:hypothetical protein M427DRAFT_58371, partial [Gonapodya prolifera JEL478]